MASTVQSRCEGLGSGFPAASTARTLNRCEPSERSGYDLPELQLSQSAESSLHSKPSSGESGEEKPKLTFGPLVLELAGPALIVVSGAIVSVSWNRSTRLLPPSTT